MTHLRTVFFGTPPLAVPALREVAATTTLVGVVCQPDKPAGRGLELAEPAVKRAALELGIEVHQPVKVKTGTLHEWIAARDVDLAVVLAYGRILPAAVLAAPKRGCVNLHASLLPKYRGAAPINWALIRGESETGISLMQMDEGMDTGPVYTRHRIDIAPTDDAGTLTESIAALAARVVREDVPKLERGQLMPEPQNDGEATLAPPITKEMTRVDWTRSAREIVGWVRGLSPKPGAMTTLRGKGLKILSARVADETAKGAAPGIVIIAEKGTLVVATGDGCVAVRRAQLEGRRALDALDLVNGRSVRVADLLGG